MRTIDIQTTQNVTINYEIALLRDRIFAFLIDVAVIFGATMLIARIILPLIVLGLSDSLLYFLTFPVYTFYTLAMESLNGGQTVGKMALQIKVVKLDGKKMAFMDYLIRWVLRPLDIHFTFGVIATIVSSTSKYGQRIGGRASNSTVVKANPNLFVKLKDVLKIETKDNYTPQYPQVKFFREQDMLLVKQSIERYTKYRNQAHVEAITMLCDNFCEKMQIPPVKEKKIKFLKTLIKDYIVLTR